MVVGRAPGASPALLSPDHRRQKIPEYPSNYSTILVISTAAGNFLILCARRDNRKQLTYVTAPRGAVEKGVPSNFSPRVLRICFVSLCVINRSHVQQLVVRSFVGSLARQDQQMQRERERIRS